MFPRLVMRSASSAAFRKMTVLCFFSWGTANQGPVRWKGFGWGPRRIDWRSHLGSPQVTKSPGAGQSPSTYMHSIKIPRR